MEEVLSVNFSALQEIVHVACLLILLTKNQ